MNKKIWNGKIEKDEFVQLQESSAKIMGLEKEEVKKEALSNDVQEARKWWNSLSTNEQNDLVKKYYSMWDYYGLSKAHEIVSSSNKRLIHIWKKTSGMTNESVKKEAEGDGSDFVVSVGNVGNIECETYEEALKTYELFVGKSKANIGRVGGEDVVLLVDGEIDKEYFGTLNNESVKKEAVHPLDMTKNFGVTIVAGIIFEHTGEGTEEKLSSLMGKIPEIESFETLFIQDIDDDGLVNATISIDLEVDKLEELSKLSQMFGKVGIEFVENIPAMSN